MRVSEKLFLKIYFSNKKVEITPYLIESMVYVWFDMDEADINYLMCPKTYHEYRMFIVKVEKEAPLLAELR